MPNVNMVVLIGTLTRDPEVKYLPSGNAVGNFSLAINSQWKTATGEKREDVTFVECEAFGKAAEVIAEYVKKGHPLYVEGRLKQDVWDDKTTGQKRSRMRVVVNEFQFLKSSGGAKPKGEAPPANAPQRDPDLDPADDISF